MAPKKKHSSKSKQSLKKEPAPGIDKRLGRIENSIKTVAQQVAKNTSEIGILRSDVKKGFDSVNGTLVVMERSISDLVTVLKEGHSPKLEKHEKTLDDHETRITTLES
jgi:hypothetical protein